MSNRPNRKPSRSAPARRPGAGAAADHDGATRRWLYLGLGFTAAIVLLAGGLYLRSRSSGPTLDAQAQKGQQVAKDKGCISCHTSSGERSEGPTWKGLYGSTVTLTDGATVKADDAYLTKAIREPGAQIVSGYKPTMPTTAVTDDELAALIAYIKALQ